MIFEKKITITQALENLPGTNGISVVPSISSVLAGYFAEARTSFYISKVLSFRT